MLVLILYYWKIWIYAKMALTSAVSDQFVVLLPIYIRSGGQDCINSILVKTALNRLEHFVILFVPVSKPSVDALLGHIPHLCPSESYRMSGRLTGQAWQQAWQATM